MLPDAGWIKNAVQNLCDAAVNAAITHVEQELSIQPRTFARKQTISRQIDQTLEEYARTRAFYITGIIKEDILTAARNIITEYVKTNLELIPTEEFQKQVLEALKDYLPVKDAAGRVVNPATRAQVIARTNVSDLYNTTRYQMFVSPALGGWVEALLYSAIMDGRTTELCRSLNGRIFLKEEINGYLPPNHFNCRSTILPVTRIDQGWRQAYDAQPPINVAPQEGFQ